MRITTTLRIILILMIQLICLCHQNYPKHHFPKYITRNNYYITINTNPIQFGYKLFKERIITLMIE